MRAPTLREWLSEGPVTLAMSSGFFGFYAHAGALAALLDAGAVVQGATGSSAGALVTGLWAGGVGPDAMRDTLAALRREDFWDPAPGLGLLRGRRFRETLDGLLRGRAIEGCAVRYAASVYDLRGRRTVALRSGDLAAAIHASCALPGLFHPVRVAATLCSDGGIADRPGVFAVPAGARALHHHLTSRSPWRRVGSASLAHPRQPGMVSVGVHGMTRVNPFALHRGMRAWDDGARGMRAALDLPVGDGVVSVEAPPRR
jgi:NTE family protein